MRKLLLSLLVIVIPLVLGACDTTEPVLKGINETVEVQCGSEFNLDQYLNENLKITDAIIFYPPFRIVSLPLPSWLRLLLF